jgi:hypothetical protein
MSNAPVSFVEVSQNAKIGLCSATYVSQVTCPATCPLKGNGCYAETGHVGIQTRRLNNASQGYTPEQVSFMEADLVRKYARKNALPLRLHVVGDVPTQAAAEALGDAGTHYTKVSNAPVWTYTHNWREITRDAFGTVSVLASCESIKDAAVAYEAGYAAAVVVEQHPDNGRAYFDEATGIKVIPCPQQTRKDVTCVECGLCMKADKLHKSKSVIAFAAHGVSKKKVVSMLKVSA